nr:ATP-binding protein [uncultured Desulfobacter sp.]
MGSNISLKNYLSRHFAVVAVLPVITIACLTYTFMLPAIKTRTGLQHHAMARSIAGQISAHLSCGKRQISAIAEYLSNRQIRNHMAPVDLLDAHCSAGDFFEALFVIDNTEGLVQTAGLSESLRPKRSDFIGMDFSGRRFIQSLKKDAPPEWSQIFLSTINSRLAVAVTIPLVKGVIIGEMPLDKLSAFISHLPLESELLTFVIDERGIVLADSLGQYWGQILKSDFTDGAESKTNAHAVSKTFELNGRRMLGTMADMDETGWKIVIAQPVSKAFQSLWEILTLIGLGLFLALVLSLCIGWFLAGNFARVVKSYIEGAAYIAGGNYNLDWPATKTKEFSLLGRNLGRMARKINQREEELKISEERTKDILVNIPSVAFQHIADPNADNSRVMKTFAQERGMQIFGLDFDDDNIIENFVACLPENDQPRFVESMEEAVKSLTPWHYEGRFIKPSGAEIWFEGRSIPRKNNNIVSHYGVLTDISRRKKMEEILIQSEKMRSVGGLAAGMAHEINNPLAGMLQTAQVMAQRLSADLDIPASRTAAQKAGTTIESIEQFMKARGIPRMIQTIITSGQRVSDIINNILSFSRKDETTLSHHFLDKILDKTVELAATDYDLKKAYDFKQIKITRSYADDLPALPCQAGNIQQVVLNILTNGAQAMQAARTPEPRFILRTYGDPVRGMICMEIEDNGPGMDEKTRKYIFEPFFTTKPVGVGTGLGLSVSYFIITENHQGEMTVESSPGAGAKFIIRLANK